MFFGVLGIAAGVGGLEGVRFEGRKVLVGALFNLSVSHSGLQFVAMGLYLEVDFARVVLKKPFSKRSSASRLGRSPDLYSILCGQRSPKDLARLCSSGRDHFAPETCSHAVLPNPGVLSRYDGVVGGARSCKSFKIEVRKIRA